MGQSYLGLGHLYIAPQHRLIDAKRRLACPRGRNRSKNSLRRAKMALLCEQ
jgi:hypothetical protein